MTMQNKQYWVFAFLFFLPIGMASNALTAQEFIEARAGDFDGDGDRDAADLDMLTLSGNLMVGYQVLKAEQAKFDLSDDGFVNYVDMAWWLSMGTLTFKNGVWILGPSTVMGDVDLDGDVDRTDRDTISGNIFDPSKKNPKTGSGRYSDGDVDGSGEVNLADLGIYERARDFFND
jgi:hypothetical protein